MSKINSELNCNTKPFKSSLADATRQAQHSLSKTRKEAQRINEELQSIGVRIRNVGQGMNVFAGNNPIRKFGIAFATVHAQAAAAGIVVGLFLTQLSKLKDEILEFPVIRDIVPDSAKLKKYLDVLETQGKEIDRVSTAQKKDIDQKEEYLKELIDLNSIELKSIKQQERQLELVKLLTSGRNALSKALFDEKGNVIDLMKAWQDLNKKQAEQSLESQKKKIENLENQVKTKRDIIELQANTEGYGTKQTKSFFKTELNNPENYIPFYGSFRFLQKMTGSSVKSAFEQWNSEVKNDAKELDKLVDDLNVAKKEYEVRKNALNKQSSSTTSSTKGNKENTDLKNLREQTKKINQANKRTEEEIQKQLNKEKNDYDVLYFKLEDIKSSNSSFAKQLDEVNAKLKNGKLQLAEKNDLIKKQAELENILAKGKETELSYIKAINQLKQKEREDELRLINDIEKEQLASNLKIKNLQAEINLSEKAFKLQQYKNQLEAKGITQANEAYDRLIKNKEYELDLEQILNKKRKNNNLENLNKQRDYLTDDLSSQLGSLQIKTNDLTARGGFSTGAYVPDLLAVNKLISSRIQTIQTILTRIQREAGKL